MTETVKDLIKRRRLIPVAVWFLLYMILFVHLEIRPHKKVHLVSTRADEKIPHVPQAIYPYLSWFPFVAVCVFLAIRNLSDEDYEKALAVLSSGMNVFILLAYVWPTGLDLREGITYNTQRLSGRLMKFVQTVDTSQSVFPSMHAYVAMVMQGSLEMQSQVLPAWAVWIGRILSVSILISTVLTKQHSVLDVVGAAALYGVTDAAYDLTLGRGRKEQQKN